MKITYFEPAQAPTIIPLPVYSTHVRAGFPSPADDYIENTLDLNQYLVKHPSATFFARAEGLSMVNAGIMDGALLVVDRSLTPKHQDIVIAAVDGDLTCKIIDAKAKVLRAASPYFDPIPVGEDTDCVIQGVVTHAINPLCTHS